MIPRRKCAKDFGALFLKSSNPRLAGIFYATLYKKKLMPNNLTIRKSEAKDISTISEMARQMADYHRSLDSYYKNSAAYKTLEEDLASELEDKDSGMLVAEEGGKIIGYFRGMIEPAPMYLSPKKIGVVYDLFVLPEFRREKIGDQLFAAALAWFEDRGARNIELSVDARNAAGVAFWKKHGFFEYKIRMRKDLG